MSLHCIAASFNVKLSNLILLVVNSVSFRNVINLWVVLSPECTIVFLLLLNDCMSQTLYNREATLPVMDILTSNFDLEYSEINCRVGEVNKISFGTESANCNLYIFQSLFQLGLRAWWYPFMQLLQRDAWDSERHRIRAITESKHQKAKQCYNFEQNYNSTT